MCTIAIIILVIIFIGLLIASLKVFYKLNYVLNKCSKHLVGKVVVVTGGSAGIGFETAKDLADRGARVIIACNCNDGRGATARDEIVSATGNQDVQYRYLDLASFTSVRNFAVELMEAETHLDILINNAGVLEPKNLKSEDGLSLGMQINYFGPFLLTNLLLPLLKRSPPSRIINVASTAYRAGTIDFENLNMEKENDRTYSMSKLYSNSKLCTVLMTVELERQLRGTGVTANCLHPGLVNTSISDRLDMPWLKYFTVLLNLVNRLLKTAWEGAQTTIYLAVSPEVNSVSGCYFSDCRQEKLTEAAQDPEVAKKLWEFSEQLVKLK